MLGQRRRRWPNINPILSQFIVFHVAIKTSQELYLTHSNIAKSRRLGSSFNYPGASFKFQIRHTILILWMTDSQQKQMERASDFFSSKKKI